MLNANLTLLGYLRLGQIGFSKIRPIKKRQNWKRPIHNSEFRIKHSKFKIQNRKQKIEIRKPLKLKDEQSETHQSTHE